MRALRLHGAKDLQLHDEPMPEPKVGEEVIRVSAVGVCGSDLHWFAEEGIGDARLAAPLILGHEFAGEIVDGEQRGLRVAVDPAISCGTCEYCAHGHPNLCPKVRFAGHGSQDGALREYLAWPKDHFYPLPDSLSDEDGAMLEPLGVAIHAVDLGHLRTGMTVGIFGCGPIGLLAVQLARLSGATQIIATDKMPHRLEMARKFGADQIYRVKPDSKEIPAVMDATHGRGVDVSFEMAGENEAVETSVAAARPGGTVILGGIPADDLTTFTASIARRKGLTFKLVRRMKHTYPRAIRLVDKGHIDVRSIVTHRFPLMQGQEAFQMANERQGLKIVINP